jgi:hypothetical protein
VSGSIGKVIRSLTLPEKYAYYITQRHLPITDVVEWAWWRWRNSGRTDWPVMARGQVKRKQTTVSLEIRTATDIDHMSRILPAFSFSAWAERVLQEAYPRTFLPNGEVAWT